MRWYPIECVHGYDCCPQCDGPRRDPYTLRPVSQRAELTAKEPSSTSKTTAQRLKTREGSKREHGAVAARAGRLGCPAK